MEPATIRHPSDSRALPHAAPARTRWTREGCWAIALTGWVLLAAVMSHASLMLLVFCMLVAVLAVGWIQARRNMQQLAVALRLPEYSIAGRPFRLEFHVDNPRRVGTARAVMLSTDVHPAPSGNQPSVFLAAISPRGRDCASREIVLPARGRYRLNRVELASRFPFGFVEHRRLVGKPQEILAYPRMGKLSRRFFQMGRERSAHQAGRRPGLAMIEADYHGLREFRSGDSPRWIHWATSARRAKWMVKEFESPQNRDVIVLVDPWLPDRSDALEHSLLELTISFAATLCVELCQRHAIHVVLGIASNPPIVRHGSASDRLVRELLEQLALVEGIAQPAWDALLAELPIRCTTQMWITSVSPRPLGLAARIEASVVPTYATGSRFGRRLLEVDVSSGRLRDYFELHDHDSLQS